MKFKILLIFLALILLVNFARAEDVKIDLISQEPAIITPGNYFALTFEAENTDLENITDIEFELKPGSELTVEGNEIKKFGVLQPGIPVILTYRLRVNSDATTGYKDLELEYDNGDSDSENFNVFVNAVETNLILKDVKQEDFIPGNKGKLTINLQNQASYKLKDVKVILDLRTVPFAPSGDAAEKTIAVMNGYGSEALDFELIALPDAEAGVYKIPITIIYFDEFSRPYNKTNMISIIINAYPFLDSSVETSELVQNMKSKVTVKFVNRGLTGIKFLNVKLLESTQYNILSADNYYVGDVSIDDYQSVDFDLFSLESGNINLPMMISYKDANNKDYISTLNLNAKVYNQNEAKQMGLVQSGNYSYIIFVIISIVIIILIYRKYRRRK